MEAHRNSAGICQVQRICIKTGLGTQLNPDSYGAASKEWSPTGENLILSGERTNPISSSIIIPQNPSDVRFWWCFDCYNYNLWLHITIDKPLLQDYIGEKKSLEPPSTTFKHGKTPSLSGYIPFNSANSCRFPLKYLPGAASQVPSTTFTEVHLGRISASSWVDDQLHVLLCTMAGWGSIQWYPLVICYIAIENGNL